MKQTGCQKPPSTGCREDQGFTCLTRVSKLTGKNAPEVGSIAWRYLRTQSYRFQPCEPFHGFPITHDQTTSLLSI